MGKNKDAENESPTAEQLAADNAALKAQIAELRAAVAAQPKGVLMSPAELNRMLGTEGGSPMERQNSLPTHPETGKPYFNDLRPTGRA